MKAVIQRVSQASVSVKGTTIGKIDTGFMILVGIHEEDTSEDSAYLAQKISRLRVFEDKFGKMNLTIKEIGGSILSISQFTLYASTKKGNRPSFTEAAHPEKAKQLYEEFNEKFRELSIPIATGEFGAMMEVSLINDGPVTLIIDTKERM